LRCFFANYADATTFRQLKDLHLDLLGRVEASNPSLGLVMPLFDEYNGLTHQLESHAELKDNMQLQGLNSRVLNALTRKSFEAFIVEANAMNA
jgi:hypothetical protein